MDAQRQKDTKTVVIMYKNYFTYYSFGIIQKKKKNQASDSVETTWILLYIKITKIKSANIDYLI